MQWRVMHLTCTLFNPWMQKRLQKYKKLNQKGVWNFGCPTNLETHSDCSFQTSFIHTEWPTVIILSDGSWCLWTVNQRQSVVICLNIWLQPISRLFMTVCPGLKNPFEYFLRPSQHITLCPWPYRIKALSERKMWSNIYPQYQTVHICCRMRL